MHYAVWTTAWWITLVQIAVHVEQGQTQDPTTLQSFYALLRQLHILLPCVQCRLHARTRVPELLTVHPAALTPTQMVLTLRNRIREAQGKAPQTEHQQKEFALATRHLEPAAMLQVLRTIALDQPNMEAKQAAPGIRLLLQLWPRLPPAGRPRLMALLGAKLALDQLLLPVMEILLLQAQIELTTQSSEEELVWPADQLTLSIGKGDDDDDTPTRTCACSNGESRALRAATSPGHAKTAIPPMEWVLIIFLLLIAVGAVVGVVVWMVSGSRPRRLLLRPVTFANPRRGSSGATTNAPPLPATDVL